MSVDSVPRDLRGLRACLLCSLVKSVDQFEMDGCDNCDRVLHMKGDQDKVYECTRFEFLVIVSRLNAFCLYKENSKNIGILVKS